MNMNDEKLEKTLVAHYQDDPQKELQLSFESYYDSNRYYTRGRVYLYAQKYRQFKDLDNRSGYVGTGKRIILLTMQRAGPKYFIDPEGKSLQERGFQNWMFEVMNMPMRELFALFGITPEQFYWQSHFDPESYTWALEEFQRSEDVKYRPVSLWSRVIGYVREFRRIERLRWYIQKNYSEFEDDIFSEYRGIGGHVRDLREVLRNVLTFEMVPQDVTLDDIPAEAFETRECKTVKTCEDIKHPLKDKFWHLTQEEE